MHQKNSTPLVSVLIPAYNAEKYIAKTIESIQNQTYKNIEIIVADDKSKDHTIVVVKKLALKDRRIKLIENEKNLYIAENRNVLVKEAKGKYIAWQDADDESLPNRLDQQVRLLETDKEVGIVGGGMIFFNDITGVTSQRLFKEKDHELRSTIFRYSPVAQPSAMIRKKALDLVGEYDPTMPPAEDLDMSFRIGMHFKFANIREPIVRYREHPNSATFTKLRTIEKNTIKIRLKYGRSGYYRMKTIDKIYNYAQWLSMYTVPARTKIWLFNIIRNRRADEYTKTY